MVKGRLGKIVFWGLVLRLAVWPWVYHEDVKTYYWWGRFAHEFGLKGYYNWLDFGAYWHPDQPMLMILIVRAIRQLYLAVYSVLWWINVKIPLFPSKIMQWYFEEGNIYLIKLVWILADLAIIVLVYRIIKDRYGVKKAGAGAWMVGASLPLIYNSAVWGNVDGWANWLALLGIYWLIKKRRVMAAGLVLSSFLVKPSLLVWIPVMAAVWFWSKPTKADHVKMLVFGLFLVWVTAKPFAVGETFGWVMWVYQEKILPGCMMWLTANAANFWAMIFGFTKTPDDIRLFGVVTFRLISLVTVGAGTVWVTIKLIKNFCWENIWWALAAMSMLSFCFMTRMHERYSFPALVPLIILSAADGKFKKYYLGITITHMLNVAGVWSAAGWVWLEGVLSGELTVRLVSLVNVLMTIKLLDEWKKKKTKKQIKLSYN